MCPLRETGLVVGRLLGSSTDAGAHKVKLCSRVGRSTNEASTVILHGNNRLEEQQFPPTERGAGKQPKGGDGERSILSSTGDVRVFLPQ